MLDKEKAGTLSATGFTGLLGMSLDYFLVAMGGLEPPTPAL
jgi:hypothetical protein